MSELDGVDAVVCDVGGVFVVPGGPVLRDLLDGAGLAVDDDSLVRAHYHGMAAYDRSSDAPERWPSYVSAYLHELGGTDDGLAEALLELWRGPSGGLWVHRLDRNVAALADLASAGWPLAIVSNSDGGVEALLRDHGIAQVGPGVGSGVVVVVDSGALGVAKPDPAVFAPALAALDRPPSRCCYVGDSYRNDVIGARAAGMPVIQLDPLGLALDDGQLRVPDLPAAAALLAEVRGRT